MRPITVREFIDGAARGKRAFLNTFRGLEEVNGIRWPEDNPTAMTETMAFMVHPGTELLVEDEAA